MRAEVSVVIPTKDRRDLLSLTLQSVLDQRDVEIEVIVVDDGSADDTAGLVRDLSDPRVRLVRNETSRGVGSARNSGVQAAGADWVAFLDDDDLWAPDKLRAQLDEAHRSGREWVYTGHVSIDGELRILAGGPPLPPEAAVESLPRYNPIAAGSSSVLVRAELLSRAGSFDPRLQRTEDWDMWIRLARLGPPACVCRPLVAYRMHSGNMAWDPQQMVSEPMLLAARHRLPIDRAATYRRAAWVSLRAGRRRAALRFYAGAIMAGDVRSVARAVVALTHPAVGTDRLYRLLPRGPHFDDWVREARLWLDRLAGSQPVGTPPPLR